MVHEVLAKGKENPTTGRELARIFNTDIRDITQQIERERREGFPICAASGETPGYYLADNREELEIYCSRLYRRGGELFKTRRALLNILKQLPDIKEQQEQSAGK